MNAHLENTKIQFERGKQADWYITVRATLVELRTTWERAVEEALSPVIKRLANRVDTKELPKLAILTIQDCKVMRDAFGRCSNLLHSTAEALNKPTLAPEVINTEIDALAAWITDIRERQERVKITEIVTISES
jgi:hypothetical protein